MVDLDTLLRESDIISLHAPATAENDGIFNYEAFSKMKNDALFVNCARGALVDEPGLIRALKEGQIAGAATDVLRTEPPKADDPMYDAPNLIISPHLAGGSNVTSHEGSIQWAENVAAILVGKTTAQRRQPCRNQHDRRAACRERPTLGGFQGPAHIGVDNRGGSRRVARGGIAVTKQNTAFRSPV